ncbi:MAG: MFS transporter [Firmicutes bacterium]|nr:MFS transporter [Bacillota bacterium]
MNESQRYRRANIALFIASFITFSDIYMSQPLLPLFVRDFQLSSSQASLAVSLVIFPVGLSFLFYAPVSDTVGKKKLLSVVLVLSSFPGLLSAYARTFNGVLAGRLLDGLLLAGVPAIAMAYIGEEFDNKKLASVMGLYISGNTLGGMGGRIISGFIAGSFSWRESFLFLSVLHLLGAIAFVFLLPRSRDFRPVRYRPLNAFTHSIENFKNPLLLGAYITGGLTMFNFVGLFNLLTFRLSAPPYNFTSNQLGLLFLTYLSGTFSSASIGILSSRRGVLFSARLGLMLALAGLVLTLFESFRLILAGLILFCFGFFAAHSSATSWVSSAAQKDKAAASGLYVLFYYTGASLSGVVLSPVWDAWGWPGVIAVCAFLFFLCIIAVIRIARLTQCSGTAGYAPDPNRRAT